MRPRSLISRASAAYPVRSWAPEAVRSTDWVTGPPRKQRHRPPERSCVGTAGWSHVTRTVGLPCRTPPLGAGDSGEAPLVPAVTGRGPWEASHEAGLAGCSPGRQNEETPLV